MNQIKSMAWNGESFEYGGFCIHATGKLIVDSPLSRLKPDSPYFLFTGLKDKKGDDIYDGHILKNPRVTFEVVWREEGYWSADVINSNECIPEDELLYKYGSNYKIIGHRYTHPELFR